MKRAIIQAGGLGQRLLPYTKILPKPLLPVADRPIIEILIQQLVLQGFTDITISVGHLARLVRAVIAEGDDWGCRIAFVSEPEPLGTIGPVSLLDDVDSPLLVTNGDILTDFAYADFLDAHAASDCMLSVGGYQKQVPIPLGVFDLDDAGRVSGFREKPTIDLTCSMGVYAFSPKLVDAIPRGTYFGFDDLMALCLQSGIDVRTERHNGLWLDIGHHTDYAAATGLFLEHRERLLPDSQLEPMLDSVAS